MRNNPPPINNMEIAHGNQDNVSSGETCLSVDCCFCELEL